MKKGCAVPTGNHRYQARDGLYYNGYMGSPDLLEDMKPEWDKIVERIGRRMAEDCGWTEDSGLTPDEYLSGVSSNKRGPK